MCRRCSILFKLWNLFTVLSLHCRSIHVRYLFSEYGPLDCGVLPPLERVLKPLEVVKNLENLFVAMSAMDDLLPAHFRLDSCTPSRDSPAPPPSTPPQPYLSDLTNRFSPPSTLTPTSGAHHYATPETPISPLSLPQGSVMSLNPKPLPVSPITFDSRLSVTPGCSTAQWSSSRGENGSNSTSYVPAGSPGSSSITPGLLPSENGIPLQTTFPIVLPPGVLADLASSAGDATGRDEESSGIMSALLSEDSADLTRRLEAGKQPVPRETTWPSNDRHRDTESRVGLIGNGQLNGVVSRLVFPSLGFAYPVVKSTVRVHLFWSLVISIEQYWYYMRLDYYLSNLSILYVVMFMHNMFGNTMAMAFFPSIVILWLLQLPLTHVLLSITLFVAYHL